MTRVEAKRLLRKAHFNTDDPMMKEALVVDEIFDYFAQRIKELEANEEALKREWYIKGSNDAVSHIMGSSNLIWRV